MLVNTCNARGWNMIKESLNLTDIDIYATDIVRLRQPSRKGARPKLESSLHDECKIDTGLLLDTSNFKSKDRAADVVHLRKPSRKSTRHLPKLESSHHKVEGVLDKVKTALHKTLATTTCTEPVTGTDGSGHSNFDEGWLSDTLSEMPTRASSSLERTQD